MEIGSIAFFMGWGLLILLGFFIFYSVYALVKDKEPQAAKRIFFSGVIFLFLWASALFFEFPFKPLVLVLVNFLVISLCAVMFLPIGKKEEFLLPANMGQIDERDIMFSRAAYEEGSPQYIEYYTRHPEKKAVDADIRAKPKLGEPGTQTYNRYDAPIMNSLFEVLANLRPLTEPKAENDKVYSDPEHMTAKLKGLAQYFGANLVGVTELRDYHYYSYRGRRPDVYGSEPAPKHKYAIVYAVEMAHNMILNAPKLPVGIETAKQYMELAKIGLELAYYLKGLGYDARAHTDGNYLVVCPLVAADAGLGEIGRMGILMTEKYGPRIRLGVVTTDIPLIPGKPKSFGAQNFCNYCLKCVRNCPSQAIPAGQKEIINGHPRWQIKQEKCYGFWRKVGTDCGICINSCPYNKPDNLVHRLVRYSLRNSDVARRIVPKLDDVLYGKKPYKDVRPHWMERGKEKAE
ncbi:MAG: 4Fe-4S dicluster domain-containing protein [Dethiobacter sp.]|jgi:ferredoxin|nr:4Fe-4S dicluster domain-containing protein [Dethiobacter sp.]